MSNPSHRMQMHIIINDDLEFAHFKGRMMNFSKKPTLCGEEVPESIPLRNSDERRFCQGCLAKFEYEMAGMPYKSEFVSTVDF